MIINDLSIPEEDNSFSKGGDVRFMSNHDDRNPPISVETLKDTHDLFTRFRIEIARRFIG
jgi:hypothetical protein